MLIRLADLIRARMDGHQRPTPVSAAGAADLGDLAAGTRLHARVAAALPGRVYTVLIGERSYTLPLPLDAAPGDELHLTIVGREASRAPAPAARPGGDADSTLIRLSPTARFITALLNAGHAPPFAAAGAAPAPLLAGAPADTPAVAARLRRALTESGMFYESHQARWIAGERPLAALMEEPQARIAPLPRGEATATGHGTPAGGDTGAGPAPADPVHSSLLNIVKQQLDTLDTRQIAWHGPVWPGQTLYWEIAAPPERRPAGPDSRTWRTRLRLVLPRLGEVDAELVLGATGVGIALAARDPAAVETMAAHGGGLKQALHAAGLEPAALTVERSQAAHE